MGAKLTLIENPTAEEFVGVQQICVHNENRGFFTQLYINEFRIFGRDGSSSRWTNCANDITIAVGQTKCLRMDTCGELLPEGRDNFQVTIRQALVNGGEITYEHDFTYSEFGNSITFRVDGSTGDDATLHVESVETFNPDFAVNDDHHDSCYEDSCFVMPNTWRLFNDAQAYCVARGGHLATLDSTEEAEVALRAVTHARYEEVWIGLGNNNYQTWLDDTQVTYTNWAQDEPSQDNDLFSNTRGRRNHVLMSPEGTWRTEIGDNFRYSNGFHLINYFASPRRFLCEIPRELIQAGVPYN